jgi:putative ABC transport system substrate-binding protein
MNRLAIEAPALDVQVVSLPVAGPEGVESALVALREQLQGPIVLADPVLSDKRRLIISFAAARRLPAIYPFTDEVSEGGLLGYGVNLRELYRKCAPYVDKILKGAKPGDLPEQSSAVEIAINLQAAKPLGITVPQSLLVRADRVVQ